MSTHRRREMAADLLTIAADPAFSGAEISLRSAL